MEDIFVAISEWIYDKIMLRSKPWLSIKNKSIRFLVKLLAYVISLLLVFLLIAIMYMIIYTVIIHTH